MNDRPDEAQTDSIRTRGDSGPAGASARLQDRIDFARRQTLHYARLDELLRRAFSRAAAWRRFRARPVRARGIGKD